MKLTKILPEAEHFYNGLKDDPEAIIKWALGEIECYKSLISLIESRKGK